MGRGLVQPTELKESLDKVIEGDVLDWVKGAGAASIPGIIPLPGRSLPAICPSQGLLDPGHVGGDGGRKPRIRPAQGWDRRSFSGAG